MNFDIAAQDGLPIYRQIVDQVRRFIASGQAQAGEELPSVRALAMRHAINPMTVSKAYSLLEAEGLLERRRGMGMVVAVTSGRRRSNAIDPRLTLLEPALQAAAQQAAQLGLPHGAAITLFAQRLQSQYPDPDTANPAAAKPEQPAGASAQATSLKMKGRP